MSSSPTTCVHRIPSRCVLARARSAQLLPLPARLQVSVGSIKQVCVQIEETDWCLGETFYMPVL
jgi:hypothetical protein